MHNRRLAGGLAFARPGGLPLTVQEYQEPQDILARIRSAYQEARKEPGGDSQIGQQMRQFAERMQRQQALGEQEIQTALTRATTLVSGAQQVERLLALAQEVASLSAHGPSDRALVALRDLRTGLDEYRQALQTQMAQALCQAIVHLAQSQLAQFQSQEIGRLWEELGNAEEAARFLTADSPVLPH